MAFYHTMCFVFTVLIICNLVLYPSIFSNIFRKMFGSTSVDEKKEKLPDMPPQMRHGPRTPGSARRMEMERNAQRTMKHADPASYFAQQKQEASSKSRGLLGSVLPVYAVGIVVYFAYIMYRIFLKDKSKENEPGSSLWDANNREGPSLQQRMQQEQLQKQLSEQLKAENYPGIQAKTGKTAKKRKQSRKKDAGDASKEDADEMASLKKRLEDTERSMHRMMEMMNNMGVAMSQVTEQLTGAVPTDLAKSINGSVQQPGEEASDEGERSSEDDELDSSVDLGSEEETAFGQDDETSLVTETNPDDDEVGSSTDGDGGDVEDIGGAEMEHSDTLRRRMVQPVGVES